MRRLVIPVSDGMLSDDFWQCDHYEFYDIEGTHVSRDEFNYKKGNDLYDFLMQLIGHGVTDIIVNRVDNKTIDLFSTHKMNIFVGIPVNTMGNIIKEYINGNLMSDETCIYETT